MRPVNLLPPDERPGARRPLRGGPLAYIVLGALLAALAGVIVLVVTNNQISDRTTEIEGLKTEIAAAETRAAEASAYVQFHQVSEKRAATVANLADSRFDWEKVMRQLALVLPRDVWLTNLTGTVKPGISVNGGASVGLRESISGPALEMVGCASGQEAVARFVSALKEIDGVTRVGMQSSELPGSGGGTVSASGGCQTRKFIAQFQLVVAFDAAPIPSTGGEAAEGETAAATESSATTEAGSEGETSTEGEGG